MADEADEGFEHTGWRPHSTRIFVVAEYGLYVVLAFMLIATCLLALVGAAATLWGGVVDWSKTETVFVVIDHLLVVLMLIEILHTVLVSVRSGTLTCEPFLIVGLIASIRRMLVITLESSQVKQQGNTFVVNQTLFRTSMIELVVLGGLILVMVVSIYMLRRRDVLDGDHPSASERVR